MKEKIDWYQEVLDLEPGSKVFFPLAKLLVQNNELSRALDVLQHGLDRHPEYIEARIYLIDLLHQNNHIDTNAKINQHLSILVPLFESYAGFWQAWSNTKTGDSKLAISFLAALFHNNSLTLGEIFTKGLQVIGSQTAKSGGSFDGGSEQSDKDPAIGNLTNQNAKDITEDGEDDVALIADENFTSENNISDTSFLAEDNLAAQETTNEENISDEVNLVGNNTLSVSGEVASSLKVEEKLLIQKQKKPKLTISINKPKANVDANTEEMLEEEEEEERFSLRTRSMAEVLAEQGDYAGAVEIYQELISNAASSQEKEDLQYRMSTLSAYVGNTQEKPVVEEDVAKSPGKDRILSVLETLAVRLESRVQS